MLELKNISKKYSNFHLDTINLSISKGDYYVVLGESGAGKSLVLEIIAGIRNYDSGELSKSDLRIGMMFQKSSVFPHKTVEQNIAYALTGMSKQERVNEVLRLANLCGLSQLLSRYPENLSGGEIQRTVLARTLAAKPDVILLDEPLRSLDKHFQFQLQALLRDLNRQGQTFIHVTHDYNIALALANKLAFMHKGKLLQSGTITEVFSKPRNQFIASFIGMHNFFILENTPESKLYLTDDIVFDVPSSLVAKKEICVFIPESSVDLYRSYSDKSFRVVDKFLTDKGYCGIVQSGGVQLYVNANFYDFDIGSQFTVNITNPKFW